MGKTVWQVANIKKKQKRRWDCSLRNATGQRIFVRQMTFHEAFFDYDYSDNSNAIFIYF